MIAVYSSNLLLGTGGGGGGGGDGLISLATLTLTDAQIKALPTTAVEIVAAPGAGKIIIPFKAMMWMHSVAVYTNINTVLGAFGIIADSSFAPLLSYLDNTDVNTMGVTKIFAGAPEEFGIFDNYTSINVVDPDVPSITAMCNFGDIRNLPYNVSVNNRGSGDFTGGNVANSLKIYLWYTTLTL